MTISAADVKSLREMTGAGMMDCKEALSQTKGDIEKAVEYLRKKGMALAQKRAGREVKEGVVISYMHPGNRLGVLVEVNCETDFVARNDEFRQLAKDLALHVVAAKPQYARREEVPADVVAEQTRIFLAQVGDKPAPMREKIAEGKLVAWYGETVLLDQKFVKDETKTVREVIMGVNSRTGENVSVARFARFVVGEAAG
jgi:elongation factor Ts